MRSLGTICAVLALAAATPALAEPKACSVEWTGMTRTTVGDDNLDAMVWRGAYAIGKPGAFAIQDDDGVFTLAALVASWQSDGRAQKNLAAPVNLSRAEVELALAAARIGLAYQASVLRAEGAALDEEKADNEARQEFMRALTADLRKLLDGNPKAGAFTFRKGYIDGRLGAFLEAFAPGGAEFGDVYYVDPDVAEDAGSKLCDPKAANPVLAEICGRSFKTHAPRGGGACPAGVAFPDPTKAKVCDTRLENDPNCPVDHNRKRPTEKKEPGKPA